MTLSLFLNKYLYGVHALYLPKAKENSCWGQKFLSLSPELKGTLGGIVPPRGFLWRISEEGTRPHIGKCCLLLWDPGFSAVSCNHCHNPGGGGYSCSPVKPSHSPKEIEQRTYFWVETSLICLEKSGCHDHNSAECYISPMGFEEKSQNSYIPSLSLPIDESSCVNVFQSILHSTWKISWL